MYFLNFYEFIHGFHIANGAIIILCGFLNCPDVNINLHVCECRSSESIVIITIPFYYPSSSIKAKDKKKNN